MRHHVGFSVKGVRCQRAPFHSKSAQNKPFVLTLDGPAAVGKSSVAARVATDLRMAYLDSGSLFRTVAFLFRRTNAFDFSSEAALRLSQGHFDEALKGVLHRFAEPNAFQVKWREMRPCVLFSGEDIEAAIRREENGRLTSLISQRPIVREGLLTFQHQFVHSHGETIAVGRDAGSIVFPDASLKIFLTASVKVRARRRWLELRSIDSSVTLKSVAKAISQRDMQDRQRALAPLVVPKGAKIISTSQKSLAEVVAHIKTLFFEDKPPLTQQPKKAGNS